MSASDQMVDAVQQVPSASISKADELIASLRAKTHHAKHPKVQDYTGTSTEAILQQLFNFLAKEESEALLSYLIVTQANTLAKQAVGEDARRAARISAQEAFTGSYDAVERKWSEFLGGFGLSATTLTMAAVAVVGPLIIGLEIVVWRFALYGFGRSC